MKFNGGSNLELPLKIWFKGATLACALIFSSSSPWPRRATCAVHPLRARQL
ncbi:hypothetical protein TorRG33x02_348230, partial [Trema orientale]